MYVVRKAAFRTTYISQQTLVSTIHSYFIITYFSTSPTLEFSLADFYRRPPQELHQNHNLGTVTSLRKPYEHPTNFRQVFIDQTKDAIHSEWVNNYHVNTWLLMKLASTSNSGWPNNFT